MEEGIDDKIRALDICENGVTSKNKRNRLVFYVNTVLIEDYGIEPEWNLIHYLRNKLGLCGTKLGCSEGGCGACTVMVSRYDRQRKKINHFAANACLMPICAVHGLAVTTIEGIGSTKTKLHPVQERIAKSHGAQCGFCTPGIVMSMYALLRSKPIPSMNDIDIAFQGNLCRCTGYRPIIEGYKTFTHNWEHPSIFSCSDTEEKTCCRRIFTSEPSALFNTKEFAPYDHSQEPLFPPILQLSSALDEELLVIKGKNVSWYRPTNLNQLLLLKYQFQNSKIVGGNTEIGVEVNIKHMSYPVLISSSQIFDMQRIDVLENSVLIGASNTLTEIHSFLRYVIETKEEYKTRIFQSMANMLHWFAGQQIRNVATLGGNIMTSSPISDLNPILMAANTQLHVRSHSKGCRTITMGDDFFTGYRQNIIGSEETLISIEIPFTSTNQYFISYKQSKRRTDDIAIVNMAMNVYFQKNTDIVERICLTFGGMSSTTVLAKKTCRNLKNKNWTTSTMNSLLKILLQDLPLADDAPGGMVIYRRSLCLSLFFKGFLNILQLIQKDFPDQNLLTEIPDYVPYSFDYVAPKSSQYFQSVSKSQSSIDLIGRPIIHNSAYKQASGEAQYCDDIPHIFNEHFLAFILSTKAHAAIRKIDTSKALALNNVVGYLDAKSISKERNHFGCIVKDEEIFASNKVICYGQIIGAIIAKDQDTANKAIKLINVQYKDIQPVILTIEDAIDKNSYHGNGHIIKKGNAEQELSNSDHTLEGEVRISGQEHFYLEPQVCIAIPKEDGDLEMFSSTQDPSGTQHLISHLLDVPFNKINVKVKRLGGGFGGKESRSLLISLPVALAAHRLRVPVRCVLDRADDMLITGTRHPFLFKYKVGFSSSGAINALHLKVYANAGCSFDLSMPALYRAMFHVENAYNIPAMTVEGQLCKTNLPSNTAFRGFGGPQAMFAAETIINHVADYLNKDVTQLRQLNLYREGDITHYNQKLENCTLLRCWTECCINSNFFARLEEIKKYNNTSRYRKKGLAMVPTKFGIAFETVFLNQAGALVHVYKDGSVLLTHGGVEMGQGIHVKAIQVASRVLRVDSKKIIITETATDKVPNTTATAGSVSSDLNGMAVMDACNQIMKRLDSIIKSNPDGVWEKWVEKAYLERISLSATGFYRTPNIGYDFKTNSGKLFNYFTYGAACSEVEIDCLTGDHRVLRTDIVMDLGKSLNPAIDIGQVEGAFIQGYGLFTMEELIYSPNGSLLSRGPGSYKIPGFGDIPLEFNVALLEGSSNPRAAYSSKAVGEPPLFLASSIFFAINNAIKFARKEVGLEGYFRFDSPATVARIRLACIDEISKMADGDNDVEKKSWNIVP